MPKAKTPKTNAVVIRLNATGIPANTRTNRNGNMKTAIEISPIGRGRKIFGRVIQRRGFQALKAAAVPDAFRDGLKHEGDEADQDSGVKRPKKRFPSAWI